jgi:hypothetical protein
MEKAKLGLQPKKKARCYGCAMRRWHLFHDNGDTNEDFDWESWRAQNGGPNYGGEAYSEPHGG